jgi:hypothetical protein
VKFYSKPNQNELKNGTFPGSLIARAVGGEDVLAGSPRFSELKWAKLGQNDTRKTRFTVRFISPGIFIARAAWKFRGKAWYQNLPGN